MENKKFNILLFSTKGAGEHYYGPGISAFRLYKDLNKSNYNLYLAHGYREQADLKLFNDQYFISDLKNGGILNGVKFYRKMKGWVSKYANRFDVVHCLGAFHASFLIAMAFENKNVPVFIKITESQHTGFNKSSWISKILGMQHFRKKNANIITGYISISSEITDKLVDAGINSRKIHFIPNGVDIDRFFPVTQNKKIELRQSLLLPDKFTFLFTGAFSNRKNPFLLVESFKPYYNKDGVQLILIGPDRDDGEQRRKINELIKSKGIKNVVVKDHQNKIEKFYQAADVFVLPSAEEGLSNSMLEALACGLPVITTKISGSEDVINEAKNGIFVNRNKESISNALSFYYQNDESLKDHSQAARTTIVNGYSSKTVLHKHLQLFLNTKYNR